MFIPLIAGLLFFPALVCTALALYAWRHRTVDGARLLVPILAGSALAMFAYGAEILLPDLPSKLLAVQIRYLGISLVAPAFMLAALWYAGYDQWLQPRRIVLLVLLPALSEIGFLTNAWHHLHYVTVGLDHVSGFPELAKTNGPLYWFYIAHALAYSFIAIGIMLQTFLAAPWAQRAQTGLVLFGTTIPTITTLVYLAGIRPYGFFNLMLPSFTLTGLTYGWAIFRHNLLDLRPIAYRAVLDRIQIGVIILDHTGCIVDLNRTAQSDLKVSARAAMGKTITQTASAWHQLAEHWARSAPAHEDVVRELDGVRRVFTVETSTLGTHADGQLVLLRDVTIHRQREQDTLAQHRALTVIEEREKMARELHDGIAQVMGYMHTQTNIALDQLAHDQIETAETTLATMRDVAHDAHADLRDFILGVRSGETPTKEFFATLEKYLEQFRANYHVPVTLSKPDDWRDDTLDPNIEAQLLRVIQEALTNARKHAQASALRVTFTLTEHTAQVIVADDGRGFAPASVEQGKDGAGTHFGLPMMRERMNEISGTLEIRSALGQGTQVIVQVPRAEKTATRFSHLRVLLVDDQPLFRDGLKNMLAARGVHVVGVASNGYEAIAQTRQLHPDLVLMDVQMPELDGVAALKQIKIEMPQTKIILLTVSDTAQTLHDALSAGVNGYLLKNLNPREFFDMLERIVGGETLIAPDLAAKIMTSGATPPAPSDDLSTRHKRILVLMAQGKTNKEIANEFVLTEAGVKYHVRQILERLQVASREEAVALAQKRGWVNP